MGKPLKNPPVYFTLAQVRFNSILKLAEFLPAIQDGMRKAGFPAFSTRRTFVLQVGPAGAQAAAQPMHQEQYVFANVGQTHSFLLDAAGLTLQSTRYGTYESFSTQFLDGLARVHETIDLDYSDRVGLRYLDHVSPRSGDALEKYLAPEVRGLARRLAGKPVHSLVEALNSLNDTYLRSRIFISTGKLAFPPDLQPDGLLVEPRFAGDDGLHATLDTDGFVQGREVFSVSAIRAHLDAIHDAVSEAFETVATDYARKMWDKP